jgi:basic amino acid/polyamine antiporter, APA family
MTSLTSTTILDGTSSSVSSYRWLRRKPLWVVEHQESSTSDNLVDDSSSPRHSTPRHLSLFDLISVGIGGTIGSGIFVLAGSIAHHDAGPSTILSFAMAGLAAILSGMSFAELAGRLPASGSTYVYTYVAMGEIAAVMAGACLTLEYAIAGAAVARSWGDKAVRWILMEWTTEITNIHANNTKEDEQIVIGGGGSRLESWLRPGYGINPLAFIISALCLVLLLNGVKETKFVSNFFTMLKLILIIFMIVGGFYFYNPSNLQPFAPFGISGILRGATSSFFAYLGYDEICCIAGESIHPRRDLPIAVLSTLAIVTIVYMLAALALTGMQPYHDIDDTSGFPMAFASNGAMWIMHLTSAGEILTLPVVVLLSQMAQPRLQAALARDGLLPEIFGRTDSQGNLTSGIWISGILMTVVAGCVPFTFLDDLISAGILVSFCMTNSCLLLLRCESSSSSHFLPLGLGLYNLLSFGTSLCLIHGRSLTWSLVMLVILLLFSLYLGRTCPRSQKFGGGIKFHLNSNVTQTGSFFEAPGVPWVPLIGIFINWSLIAQLEFTGLLLLTLYLGSAVVLYLLCCRNDNVHWKHVVFNNDSMTDDDDEGIHLERFPKPSERTSLHSRRDHDATNDLNTY